MNIINLERALRRGKTPEEIGCQRIGQGVSKTAYLYTTTKGAKYVVKLDLADGFRSIARSTPPDLRKYGVSRLYHTRAGKYCIQEYTRVLADVEKEHPAWNIFNVVSRLHTGDYHSNNFGVRENGELVCFDW